MAAGSAPKLPIIPFSGSDEIVGRIMGAMPTLARHRISHRSRLALSDPRSGNANAFIGTRVYTESDPNL